MKVKPHDYYLLLTVEESNLLRTGIHNALESQRTIDLTKPYIMSRACELYDKLHNGFSVVVSPLDVKHVLLPALRCVPSYMFDRKLYDELEKLTK